MFIVPNPNNAFPATDDRAVRNTSGESIKVFGKVTCTEVCSFGFGVILVFPTWIPNPPKVEFSKINEEFLPEYTYPGVL